MGVKGEECPSLAVKPGPSLHLTEWVRDPVKGATRRTEAGVGPVNRRPTPARKRDKPCIPKSRTSKQVNQIEAKNPNREHPTRQCFIGFRGDRVGRSTSTLNDRVPVSFIQYQSLPDPWLLSPAGRNPPRRSC